MDFENLYNNWTTTSSGATTTVGNYTFTYPSNWSYTISKDKGEMALNILKGLRAKKLLKVDNIDTFIEAMTLIMKEL